MKPKHIAGVSLLIGLGTGAYFLFRPTLIPTEEKIGVEIVHYELQRPYGREIIPGSQIKVAVRWKNISEGPRAVKLRAPINPNQPAWLALPGLPGASSWLGNKAEDWQRFPAEGFVEPGDELECEVLAGGWTGDFRVPSNWKPGWEVSVRLDLEGVTDAYKIWDTEFVIVASPSIAEFLQYEISLDQPCGILVDIGGRLTASGMLTNAHGYMPLVARLRMPIWGGDTTPIGDREGDWVSFDLVAGETKPVSIGQTIPGNWIPGRSIGVRVDLDEVGEILREEGCYTILATAPPGLELLGVEVGTQYTAPVQTVVGGVVVCPANSIPVWATEMVSVRVLWRNPGSTPVVARFTLFIPASTLEAMVPPTPVEVVADPEQEVEVVLQERIPNELPQFYSAAILVDVNGVEAVAIWTCHEIFQSLGLPSPEDITVELV